MADSLLRLKVDSQEYDSKLKRAAQGLDAYVQKCRNIGGTLAIVEEETLKFVQALGGMDTVAKGGTQSIREMSRSITDLTLTYRSLTDEEKGSPFGQALAKGIQQLTERAGEARDAMNDVNAAIQNAASDTRVFDQIAGAAGITVSSFQTLQGAAKLLGVDMGDNVEVIAKLQAAMAVTNGLTQIQNSLQKESAVMQGIATVQTTAHAAAQALLAKNTKMATVAGEALNAVSKMNPYVLLASAIAAVISALVAYSKHQKQAAADTKLNEEALQRAKKATEDYRSTLSSEYAQMMAKFDELKRAWMSISGEAEKIKWIKDNKKAFDDLGISVNNLKSAEDVFEQNTATVIDGFRRRAEAAAIAANMVELYRQKMDLQQQAVDVYNQKRVQAYYTVPKEYLDQVRKTEGLRRDDTPNQWGETTYNNGRFIRGKNDTGPFTFSKEEADAYNNALKTTDTQLKTIIDEGKKINQTIEQRNQRLMELEKNQAKTTKTDEAIYFPAGSLPQLTQQLKDLQEAQSQALNPREWVEYQQQIEQTQFQIEAFKGQWRDGLRATFTINDSKIMDQFREVEGMIVDEKTMTVTVNTADAYNQVRSLTSDIEGTTVEFKVQPELARARGLSITTTVGLNAYISQLKQQIDQADLGSELYNSLTSKLADVTMLQNLVKESLSAGLGTALFDVADETGQDFWDRVISPEGVADADWQSIADKINTKLQEMGLDPIAIDVKTGKVTSQSQKPETERKSWEQSQQLVSGLSQVNSGLQQIGIKLPDGVQKIVSGAQGLISVINGIQTIIYTFSTASVSAEVTALTANTAATTALTAAMAANTAVQGSDAIIDIVKDVVVMGAAAAMAHGGIVPHAAHGYAVPGTHYSGDTTPILANAGELILNRAQQGNIASQLQDNNSEATSKNIQPYVLGDKIYLGVNNYLRGAGYGEIITTSHLRRMGLIN